MHTLSDRGQPLQRCPARTASEVWREGKTLCIFAVNEISRASIFGTVPRPAKGHGHAFKPTRSGERVEQHTQQALMKIGPMGMLSSCRGAAHRQAVNQLTSLAQKKAIQIYAAMPASALDCPDGSLLLKAPAVTCAIVAREFVSARHTCWHVISLTRNGVRADGKQTSRRGPLYTGC